MRQAFLVERPRHAALRALNYEPSIERLRRRRRGSSSTPLQDLVTDLGSGYASVFARVDCDRGHGVELLSQSDMFAAEPVGRVIRRDSMQHPERHEVKKWHVLVAGAGTLAPTELYGRAIVADGRLVGKYIGQDSLRIEFAEPDGDEALFAYAYLASPTGLRALRSTSYGTKILRIRRDVLSTLPVPHPGDDVQSRIAALVRRTVEQRERYFTALAAARREVENLPEMRAAHDMCAERAPRSASWSGPLTTLSAWNYASTGGALSLLNRAWRVRLRDALESNGAFNGPRFGRIECDPPHGVDFFSQRDAFLIRPAPRRIVRPSIPDRLLFVPESAILAGSHGQIGDGGLFGRVELASFGAHQAGVTQDLLRLLFRERYRATAFAYLSTRVGERLLKSTAVGTSIPSMRLDLLGELPFPDVSSDRAAAIGRHVATAEAARVAASSAEREAMRLIEHEVMPAWLA
ncbi:MAG: hypothetical protein U0263_31295 [Polyangiaceae bacterium]